MSDALAEGSTSAGSSQDPTPREGPPQNKLAKKLLNPESKEEDTIFDAPGAPANPNPNSEEAASGYNWKNFVP